MLMLGPSTFLEDEDEELSTIKSHPVKPHPPGVVLSI